MKLIEYKKISNRELELAGEQDMNAVRTNHTYKGKLNYVHDINCGLVIDFLKKEDVESFKNGKNEITVYSVRMKESYTGKNNVSLSHSIGSYANGLLIDEIKSILEQYPNEEYCIMSATNLGQFFTYDAGEKGMDYTLVETKKDEVRETKITIINEKKREPFTFELHDVFAINDVLDEIHALKISEDVLFVHHENGVGYATRDMGLLQEIAGYVYQNYLIEE